MLLPVFSSREGQMRNHRQFGGQSNNEKFRVAKQILTCQLHSLRVRKYAKFAVFYAKIVQFTPLKLQKESLRLQKFSVTNREPL